MGLGTARVSDSTWGICYCHKKRPIAVGGTIVTGSVTTFADGLQVSRLGDVVVAGCGHSGVIINCSGTTFADGIGWARLGDNTTGCYVATIISSSGTTFTV